VGGVLPAGSVTSWLHFDAHDGHGQGRVYHKRSGFGPLSAIPVRQNRSRQSVRATVRAQTVWNTAARHGLSESQSRPPGPPFTSLPPNHLRNGILYKSRLYSCKTQTNGVQYPLMPSICHYLLANAAASRAISLQSPADFGFSQAYRHLSNRQTLANTTHNRGKVILCWGDWGVTWGRFGGRFGVVWGRFWGHLGVGSSQPRRVGPRPGATPAVSLFVLKQCGTPWTVPI
jgi:hypothetical protein